MVKYFKSLVELEDCRDGYEKEEDGREFLWMCDNYEDQWKWIDFGDVKKMFGIGERREVSKLEILVVLGVGVFDGIDVYNGK